MQLHGENPNPKRRFLITAVAFMEILAIGGAVALLYERPTVSVMEKRALATMPKLTAKALFSGEYTRELSEFFADTFPAREGLVRLAAVLQENAGLRLDDIRLHEGTAQDPPVDLPSAPAVSQAQIEPVQSEATAESSGSAALAPDALNAEEAVRAGAIICYKGRGFQIFGSEDAMGQWYAQVINTYHQALGSDVKIYNLVIPSAIEFGLPAQYKSVTMPEKPKLENIYQTLDPAVSAVNVYDVFAQHSGEYLYFGTDHHWTSLGAYWAYTVFAQTAGFEPVELGTLEKRTLTGFLGTLYAQTNDSKMAEHPDYVDYYMMPTPYRCYLYFKNAPYSPLESTLYGEYAKSPNSYSVFLQGDYPLMRIETGLKNGRRIAVVKESYGNAFAPFLVNHYEQILVVDQRYLQVGLLDLLRENRTNELLFINNIFAAYTPVRIRELQSIMNQVFQPPEPAEPQSTQDGTAKRNESKNGEEDGG